ncbi:LA2681 family HEPN domain-containing protein [Cronobacter dublinensis]
MCYIYRISSLPSHFDKIYAPASTEEKLKKLFTQSEETMSKITVSKIKINEKLKRKNHSLLISESDFESRLFLLMKLVRRSIIYLSLAVHWEQKQKRDDSPLIIPREVPLKHKIDF